MNKRESENARGSTAKRGLVGGPGSKPRANPRIVEVLNNENIKSNVSKDGDTYRHDYMEEEEEEGVAGRSFNFRSDVCDLWYRKENALYRRLRIVFIEFLTSLWYNTIVGIGFRMLGNSWSFGLLQGFVFASMVGLFWYEDFGFANIFVAMGLCFMRQLRSREYWIFFLHLIGHLLGTTLAMAGIVLVTNDLPGLQTFGTPTKSTLISETAAGFAEFIGSFFVAFLIFVSVLMWNESVRVRFAEDYEKKEKKRQKRHYKMPGFTIVLGLAYTALSIGFYDLTGSSFNFLRWAVPRLCMGRFDLNPRDALYYLVANFIAVALAGAIAYLLFFCKQRVEKTFVKKLRPSDGIPLV